MARKILTLAELPRLDGGKVEAAFNLALRKLAEDCDDRPGLDAARKLNFEIELKPTSDDHGVLEGVDLQWSIKPSVPKLQSRKQRLACRVTEKGGQLTFDDQTRDARQPALDDVGGEKDRD
jgi:hypothetical protein